MLPGILKKILRNRKVNFEEILKKSEDFYNNCGKLGNETLQKCYQFSEKFWKILKKILKKFWKNLKILRKIVKRRGKMFWNILKMLQGFRKILEKWKVNFEEILVKCEDSSKNC